MMELLEELGCDVIAMNEEQSGRFAHPPEPIPEHLVGCLSNACSLSSSLYCHVNQGDLCARVKSEKADLGIAVDPDVDRCVLIDETGTLSPFHTSRIGLQR